MRTMRRARRSWAPDGAQQHRDWLDLVEVSGPFLSLPVLREAWPTLDALEKPARERLRMEHGTWQGDTAASQHAWIDYVLGDLLGWGETLHQTDLDALDMAVAEHDTRIAPSFALVEPGEDLKPDTARLLGMICEPGQQPTARVPGSAWAATPVDRLAQLCRHHGIELGLVTDGRWWALVWAPRGGVTTTAVFDAVAWPESAERDVVRAFVSLLCRRRFFSVPDEETLVPLLRRSLDSQEEITEALGVQVRQAVELLVAAIGRVDAAQRDEPGLGDVDAHEVYRGAVSTMMRVVFLLFAEERGLLPSDNELYASTYSAGQLCAELERRALEGSEDDLEHTSVGWHRLLALFTAVHGGITHPRLTMHAHDGSLFDPEQFPWLRLAIDDRTVLHMLRAVQYVEIGTGRSRERRSLSFRSLDVEQIGYVYEGLLSYDGFRADGIVVGLIGKQGTEEEVSLRELEGLAARHSDVPSLAAALAAEYKDSRIGSPKALEKKLVPLGAAEREEARKKLLAVVRGDYPLAERLLPFVGLIRLDLRALPVVILPGALYVTDSPLRKNTGTHYTPRFLAEQVAEGALEPLVFEPGPLQTADKDEWKLKSSTEILSLKVADIAMGSAAFLVAAARYLGAKLLEAWIREGDHRARDYVAREPGVDEDPVVIEARRQIIEHCLYGVDINPMAVEMAKLSLWLVSMDTTRPFTFLDDRLVAGDSLLGITSLDQLEYMHMDPKKGRQIHQRGLVDFTAGVRELVADVATDRRKLAEIDGTTVEGLARKRSSLADAKLKTSRVRLFADLCAGASLANAGRGDRGLCDGSIAAADYARRIDTAEMDARQQANKWLNVDRPKRLFPRNALHWPLIFPEVFERDGFDAVIGNPPFLGGKKISGPLGSSYREHLVHSIAMGAKGNADLIAYFCLRAHSLTNCTGQAGLIGTSTLAQGDTREVGLDQMARNGVTITRSIKSNPWPSRGAALEYCAIWTSKLKPSAGSRRVCDGEVVAAITTSLTPETRATGEPRRLVENERFTVSQGSILLGLGFTMSTGEARQFLNEVPSGVEVLRPYMGGEDLNSSPSLEPRRWAIDFRDRTERESRSWPELWQWVESRVKPGRLEKDASKYPKMVNEWWKHWNTRKKLYFDLSKIDRTIALTRLSNTLVPIFVGSAQIFSDQVVVFSSDDPALLAALTSGAHYWWTISRTSTRGVGAAPRYAPSDVFDTFPLPELVEELRAFGEQLNMLRSNVMLSRESGLTKTYNLIFDPSCTDSDIAELRTIHRAIDEATVRAYGWNDLLDELDHGFHPVGRGTRYTIGPAAQREILDRLLELNHERYADEVARGLHDKNSGSRAKAGAQDEGMLFDVG